MKILAVASLFASTSLLVSAASKKTTPPKSKNNGGNQVVNNQPPVQNNNPNTFGGQETNNQNVNPNLPGAPVNAPQNPFGSKPASTGNCGAFSTRYEWRDMTQQQQSAFINAIWKLKQAPSILGQRNRYDDFSWIHDTYVQQIHHTAIFLPWHREFIRAFEKELQKLDSSVFLPYWDWGFNANNPFANTAIFGSGAYSFGTRGSPHNPCVPDGAFSSLPDNDGQCIARCYLNNVVLADDTTLSPAIYYSSNYDQLAWVIEAAHDNVHDYVGGQNGGGRAGDLYVVTRSTNDPLFYLNHANVDRLWWAWQQNNPKLAGTYSNYGNLWDPLPGLFYNGQQVTVQNVLFSGGGYQWCVDYAPYSRGFPITRTAFGLGLSHWNQESQLHRAKNSNVTVVRHNVPGVEENWLKVNAFNMGKDLKAMTQRVQENEKLYNTMSSKFSNEMDAYFAANPGCTYDEAYSYVIKNWNWKNVYIPKRPVKKITKSKKSTKTASKKPAFKTHKKVLTKSKSGHAP
ncbi:hypothetical protein BC830DRAFT_1245407 [Chytriomyces sp. MP71]|nr:hypothetical protein BC830DRAFT_1245407 [Chytriomyces sp. MP71]